MKEYYGQVRIWLFFFGLAVSFGESGRVYWVGDLYFLFGLILPATFNDNLYQVSHLTLSVR